MVYKTSGNDILTVYTKTSGIPVAAKYLRYEGGQGDYVLNASGKPLIVPYTYDPMETVQLANQLVTNNLARMQSPNMSLNNGSKGILPDVAEASKHGGIIDLQRNYNGAVGEFVPAFQDAASFNFGVFGSAAGLPLDVTLAGDGFYNLWNKLTSNGNIDITGAYFNNPNNSYNILNGKLGLESGSLMGSGHSRPQHCFPASTLITLTNNAQTTIDKIDVGTLVATYDPTANQGRGALISGIVTNTFTNISQEFIKISSACGRINSTMTPSHEILCDNYQLAV
jgi:hypothetical protein